MLNNQHELEEERMKKLAEELSSFSHEDVIIEVVSDCIQAESGSRDRRDVGH